MKTKEELNETKEEVETLNEKLHELTDEELAQVSGGDEDLPLEKYRGSNSPNPNHGRGGTYTPGGDNTF